MPHSLANILVHIVFSTKNQYPFLRGKDVRSRLHAYFAKTCIKLGCQLLAAGGNFDHVHILCTLSRNVSVATLVGEIKRRSSKWMKRKGRKTKKFSWEDGYGAFSVGQLEVQRVGQFISRQEEYHRRKTYEDEYRSLLRSARLSTANDLFGMDAITLH